LLRVHDLVAQLLVLVLQELDLQVLPVLEVVVLVREDLIADEH